MRAMAVRYCVTRKREIEEGEGEGGKGQRRTVEDIVPIAFKWYAFTLLRRLLSTVVRWKRDEWRALNALSKGVSDLVPNARDCVDWLPLRSAVRFQVQIECGRALVSGCWAVLSQVRAQGWLTCNKMFNKRHQNCIHFHWCTTNKYSLIYSGIQVLFNYNGLFYSDNCTLSCVGCGPKSRTRGQTLFRISATTLAVNLNTRLSVCGQNRTLMLFNAVEGSIDAVLRRESLKSHHFYTLRTNTWLKPSDAFGLWALYELWDHWLAANESPITGFSVIN